MPDRTQQTVKEKTSAPEIEILGPETAGALSTAGSSGLAQRAERQDGRDAPAGPDRSLRNTGAAEAAAAVARGTAGLDFGAVRPGPAFAGLQDEIDDRTADAIRQRRRNVGEAPVHKAIENGRPDEVLRVEGPPRPEKAPNMLPAIISRELVGRYDEWLTAKDDPRWLTVYDLPGYRVNAIRALGRTTFRMFPCFAAQERHAAEEVGDPLGEMAMMANFSGKGPSDKAHLDQVAGWLRQNGNVIDATSLEFPGVFDGYNPEIILTLSEERSYLLVRDTIAKGSPVEGEYIYSWKGGLAHYRKHLADAQRVVAVLEGNARRPALAGRGAAPARVMAPSRRLAMIEPPRVDPSTINLGRRMSGADKTALAALPAASSPADRGLMVGMIRTLGFRPGKDDASKPVFQKTMPDGSVVHLEPEDGAPLARAATFKAIVKDAAGHSTEYAGVGTAARLEEIMPRTTRDTYAL